MGILRIYLALCVVAAHSTRIAFWPMHTGHEAVQIFFMISGFYMELVYDKYAGVREFYTSRALRIFLPYWVVLAIVAGVSALLGWLSGNWAELAPFGHFRETNGVAGVTLAGISNVTILLQDALMFFNDSGGGRAFTSDFRAAANPLWYFLLIPQAWSISVELQFYLMVPLLAKLRDKWLVTILLLSMAARLYVYEGLGWKHDPWTSRFTPFEISFFLLGILACRFWKRRRSRFDRLAVYGESNRILRYSGIVVFCIASKLVVIGLSQWLDRAYVDLAMSASWALVLPALFSLSRKDGLDRWIGELSYPVYLVHFFIIGLLELALHQGLLNFAAEPLSRQLNPWTGTLAAVLSISVAIVLNHTVFAGLEKLRHRKIAAATPSQ
ncbi:MAG: hypothetical protein CFE26_18170 [Verrucomicrobiales bacterium VVV1]|nr:MAG: hypothetical protein CFE26_18170 [Verrucomicrobiales bacterium VVV1]